MKRVVAGPRAVLSALRSAEARRIAVVYVTGELRRPVREEVWQEANRHKVALEERTRADLDAIARGLRHQGVLAVGGDYPYRDLDSVLRDARTPPLLLALDEVTDPHNLGAIIRSAVAFGADGIVLPKHRSASVTPAVVRVSTGATEHARIARVTNLARALRDLAAAGLQLVGLAPPQPGTEQAAASPIGELSAAPGGRVLVVGSEGRGLRRLVREACDCLVHIPTPGPVESLNASVAAAIALYEASRQRAHPPAGPPTRDEAG